MENNYKTIITLFALLFSYIIFGEGVFAQNTDGVSYQAVLRNADSELLVNKNINVEISILQGSEEGVSVFSEIHTTSTNENGLVTLVIGYGEPLSGNFHFINWTSKPYFIKSVIEMPDDASFSITTLNEVLSVPFALHAQTAESLTGEIIENDPVFSSSIAAGINPEDITYWNNKLDDYIETDPVWDAEKPYYYTKSNLQTTGEAEVNWNNIEEKPTTLNGYGITDAAHINHTHDIVTTESDGFMSTDDKIKLDNMMVYVAGEGINLLGPTISTNISLRASETGDTLLLNPGNYIFIPGLSNANSELPVVKTGDVTNITSHKAFGHGEVIYYGESTITEIGVCWSENLNPTPADNYSSAGASNGDFVVAMEGLTENTIYFVRAYANTTNNTFYGQNVLFTTTDIIPVPSITTTEVSGITENTALSGGFIANDGGSAVIARGVCWNTSPAPTTANFKTTNGTGTGLFTSYITGLTLNTTYYIRGYATNANGTNYGPELIFKTAGVLPTVTTNVPQNVTATTAILGGEVTSQGSLTVTERGICFGTSPNPTTAGAKVVVGNGMGSFNTVGAILLPNTTYNVRAYATNAVGTAYGVNQTFITSDAYYEGFESGFPGGNSGGWGIVSTKSYEGFYSLYTSQHNAEAEIIRFVSNPGQVSFYLSNICCFTTVKFYIDDIEIATLQPSGQWLKYSFPVSEGEHSFKWKYFNSNNPGVWLDYIIIGE